jgi:hypothetical protein
MLLALFVRAICLCGVVFEIVVIEVDAIIIKQEKTLFIVQGGSLHFHAPFLAMV